MRRVGEGAAAEFGMTPSRRLPVRTPRGGAVAQHEAQSLPDGNRIVIRKR